MVKLLRDETLLREDRCPAALCHARHSCPFALILSHPSDPRLHSFPATLTSLTPRQALPTHTYVRTYARTRTHVRKCSRHHDPLGLAQARPNDRYCKYVKDLGSQTQLVYIRERGSVLYLGMALECWDFAKLAIV